jgi:hypothetical protein
LINGTTGARSTRSCSICDQSSWLW